MTHGNETVATPAGWTLVTVKDTGVSYEARIAVFQKIRAAETSQAFQFTTAAPAGARIELMAFRGTGAVAAVSGSGYQTSLSLTATITGPSMLVGIGGSGNNTTLIWASLTAVATSSSYPAPGAALGYETVNAAGTYTRTISPPATESITAILLAISGV
jgi:hypothetical protein